MNANNMEYVSYAGVRELASQVAREIQAFFSPNNRHLRCYPVPRGGVPVAYALKEFIPSLVITNNLNEANLIVDDLIDSGSTRARFHPSTPFFSLIDKRDPDSFYHGKWVVFPWEDGEQLQPETIEDNVRRIIQYAGDDPNRPGMLETPARVAKAWKFWTSGYNVDIPALLKVFEDGAEGVDQMVMVKDIPIYTHCEHHMAPFFGTATIAYIPDGKIVGLSKLSRVADAYARRFQVQERLTNQIADALQDNLNPRGVGVVLKCRHMCMESRGTCQQGHHTITSALRGVLRDDPAARQEFMSLAN